WSDEYHGAAMVKDESRVSSFVWRGGEGPNGLVLPVQESSMAEWRQNLTGQVTGIGRVHNTETINKNVRVFDGGFVTEGSFRVSSTEQVIEGNPNTKLAIQHLIFATLPDGRTTVVLQRAVTETRTLVSGVRGLGLQIPNDIFNSSRRTYESATGRVSLCFDEGKEKLHECESGWLNIDNVMGVVSAYGPKSFTLYSPAQRQVGLKKKKGIETAVGGMLHADEICLGFENENRRAEAGSVLIEMGAVLRVGESAGDTESFEKSNRLIAKKHENGLCEISLTADDGRVFHVIANMGDEMREWTNATGGDLTRLDFSAHLASGDAIKLAPISAIVCLSE
ncbi:MAG: hypothetical protein JXR97_08230, partial [Planctomycetes bacterium]|nr:hypothetical protein [Planctomycetota bacterium]